MCPVLHGPVIFRNRRARHGGHRDRPLLVFLCRYSGFSTCAALGISSGIAWSAHGFDPCRQAKPGISFDAGDRKSAPNGIRQSHAVCQSVMAPWGSPRHFPGEAARSNRYRQRKWLWLGCPPATAPSAGDGGRSLRGSRSQPGSVMAPARAGRTLTRIGSWCSCSGTSPPWRGGEYGAAIWQNHDAGMAIS